MENSSTRQNLKLNMKFKNGETEIIKISVDQNIKTLFDFRNFIENNQLGKGMYFYEGDAKILSSQEKITNISEIIEEGVIIMIDAKIQNSASKQKNRFVDNIEFKPLESILNEGYKPEIPQMSKMERPSNSNSSSSFNKKRITHLSLSEIADLLKNKLKASRGFSYDYQGKIVYSSKHLYRINQENFPEDISDYVIEQDNIDYTKFTTFSSIKKEIHKSSSLKIEATLSLPYVSVNSYYKNESYESNVKTQKTKYEIEKAIIPKGIITDFFSFRGTIEEEVYNFFYTHQINFENVKTFFDFYGELIIEQAVVGGVLYTEESSIENFQGNYKESKDEYGIGTKIEAACVKASVTMQKSKTHKEIDESFSSCQGLTIRNLGGNIVSIFNLLDWISSVNECYDSWDIIQILKLKSTIELLPKLHFKKIKFLLELQKQLKDTRDNKSYCDCYYRFARVYRTLNMYEEEEKNYDIYYVLINSCHPRPSYEELNFFRVRKAFCLFKLGRYYDAYMIGRTPYVDEKFYKNYCISGLSLVRLKNTDQKNYKDISFEMNYISPEKCFEYVLKAGWHQDQQFLYYCKGLVHKELCNYKDAIRLLEKALSFSQQIEADEILNNIGECLMKQNLLGCAMSKFEEALNLNPFSNQVLANLIILDKLVSETEFNEKTKVEEFLNRTFKEYRGEKLIDSYQEEKEILLKQEESRLFEINEILIKKEEIDSYQEEKEILLKQEESRLLEINEILIKKEEREISTNSSLGFSINNLFMQLLCYIWCFGYCSRRKRKLD